MPKNRCPATVELRKLLEDASDADDDPQIVLRLESCPRCRQSLERMAGSSPTSASAQDIQTAYEFYHSSRQLDSRRSVGSQREPIEPDSISCFLRDIGIKKDDGSDESSDQVIGRIGNVDLEHLLGQGGMGMVFKGRDSILDRPVAVKIIDPSLSSNALARQRFLQEARLAASINHPNVVKIHAVDDSGKTPALIMEFVEGQSLQQRDAEHLPMAESRVRSIARQIAAGLSAAHAKKIIHRDIKPGNLLQEKFTEQIKIADFGLAFATEKSSYMTSDGVVLGTPQYMSPEQIRGLPLNAQSDLFSLGTVLYEMCTGKLPFSGGSVMSVAYNVANTPITPVRQINPEISDEFSSIVDRLLCKSTDDRIQSADELIELLDGNIENRRFTTTKNGVIAGIGLTLVVLTIVFAAIKFSSSQGSDRSSDATGHRIQIKGQDVAYEDLAAACDAASPGDTILLQGVDEFYLSRREIETRQLTICGTGEQRARIVLTAPGDAETWVTLTGDLTLKHVDLEVPSRNRAGRNRGQSAITITDAGNLKLLDCRMVTSGFISAAFLAGGSLHIEDSSLFANEGVGIASKSVGENKLVMNNALIVSRNAMVWSFGSRSDLSDEDISIDGSTIRADTIFKLQQSARGSSRIADALPISFSTVQTVIAGDILVEVRQLARPGNARRSAFSEFVDRSIRWSGKGNLYGPDLKFFDSNITEMDITADSLSEWNQFWKDREQGSAQENLEFVGSRISIEERDHVLVNRSTHDGNNRRIGFDLESISK